MNELTTQSVATEIQTGQQQVPIAAMFQAVIEKGVTAENAAAIEKLCDLHLKLEAMAASKQFAAAKAQLQSDLRNVQATKAVPDRSGNVKYLFAPFESVMRAIQPRLAPHGFALSFDQELIEGTPLRLVSVCTLSHIGGHSESTRFAVRIGSGPPGANESQADGAASTYAKRYALCNMFNIVIDRMDDDGRLEGDTITAEQADDLRNRLKATGRDEARFLKFAGAATFEEIRSAKLPELNRALETADRAARSSEKLANSLDRAEPTADKLREKLKEPSPISNEEAERIRRREAMEAGKH